jgi:hypothetical protein
MSKSVFVSYSHLDAHLVEPVVQMLRGAVDMVFHDATSIVAGHKWKDDITKALAESDLVALFWCVHSAGSDEIRFEYETAISSGKDVMPLRLDGTPLPESLTAFQWVDFRGLMTHRRSTPEPSLNMIRPDDPGLGGLGGLGGFDISEFAPDLMMLSISEEFRRRGLLPPENTS